MRLNNIGNIVTASIVAVSVITEEIKNRMRIMANLIIDRFLSDRRFGSLQSDKMSVRMDPDAKIWTQKML